MPLPLLSKIYNQWFRRISTLSSSFQSVCQLWLLSLFSTLASKQANPGSSFQGNIFHTPRPNNSTRLLLQKKHQLEKTTISKREVGNVSSSAKLPIRIQLLATSPGVTGVYRVNKCTLSRWQQVSPRESAKLLLPGSDRNIKPNVINPSRREIPGK